MPNADAVTLPTNVRPTHYQITLQPDMANFTFDGLEVIEIEVIEATSTIVLNACEMRVSAGMVIKDGRWIRASSIAQDEETETVTLTFPETIGVGPAQLDLRFAGELNDKLRGFYRSQYLNPEGEVSYLATTQFEATDARRAFPCWDEPACKATFQLTLNIPANMVAVSNTPILEQAGLDAGFKSIMFARTPIMSTYLMAFVIGDLTHIEQEASSGTRVGVWTTRGKEEQGRFALETSARMLTFFNEYFGIPYPLEKLDHIAIPDFAAGAMENWGCITYRETALLVDPENSSAGTRQRVAEVVAHEMAHMWFGDLVTMEWWDDLWLNESFASWMGTKATDWAFPDWEMWTQFVNMDTNRALSLDGLKNSHPIEQEVKDPAEISQLFDAISYSKGASVIRMLEQFLTPEVFRQGLHQYLTANQYANACTEDLWAALEEASQLPVSAIMKTWTGQMGYPVLKVETQDSGDGLELAISQERFVYDNLLGESQSEGLVWQVPVGIAQGGSDAPATLVMDAPNARVQLPRPARGDGYFKVNPSQTGFFRVNYSEDDWQRLIPAIKALTLAATDRLGIQNDAYALSKAGLLSITQFLDIAAAYENETDASVWSDLASNLRDIELLVADEPYYENYRAFARDLFGPAAHRIGWDARPGEGHLDALLRSTVLGQAGGYGDPGILGQATDRFQTYLKDNASLHPDLRGVVFSLAAQAGDRQTYDQLWELERDADLQEEKIRLLLAVCRFTQAELLEETLRRTLTDEVRSQDTISVVTAVAANLKGRHLAWQFVKDNWAEFDRRYGSGGFGLMRLVSVCGNFTDSAKIPEVEEFFREHPAPAAERTIRQSLEKVRLNSRWLELNREALGKRFG